MAEKFPKLEIEIDILIHEAQGSQIVWTKMDYT